MKTGILQDKGCIGLCIPRTPNTWKKLNQLEVLFFSSTNLPKSQSVQKECAGKSQELRLKNKTKTTIQLNPARVGKSSLIQRLLTSGLLSIPRPCSLKHKAEKKSNRNEVYFRTPSPLSDAQSWRLPSLAILGILTVSQRLQPRRACIIARKKLSLFFFFQVGIQGHFGLCHEERVYLSPSPHIQTQ